MTPAGAGPSDPAAWVTAAGLTGAPELDLLRGFCERAVASGIPIRRAQILIDTLHPVHEGRVFRWRDDRTTRARTDGDIRLGGGASRLATRRNAVPTAGSTAAARCTLVT